MSAKTNPNRNLTRCLQEFLVVAVSPLAGQTRGLQFTCPDRAQFDRIRERLAGELLEQRVFLDSAEFEIHAVEHQGGSITGELVPRLATDGTWDRPEQQQELQRRIKAAYEYVATRSAS